MHCFPMAKSDIKQFFDGQTVFLTGGTGFIGKLLIEKLLRNCANLNKIYIFVRPRKGRSVQERYESIFSAKLFDVLKKQRGNDAFKSQIHLIAGDCEQKNLGLSAADEEVLVREVTCVIHGAATVNFHAHLRVAAYINVRAVQDLVKLAKKMTKLKSFVHISTLFSNCHRERIDEQFVQVPINADELLTLVDMLDDDTLTAITPHLLGKWPNTYVFTKSIAEDLIKNEAKTLPVAIIRPAIITSTCDEPIPGWIDNIYGPTGIWVGIALGVIRAVNLNSAYSSEIVPADFVINCVLAIASRLDNTLANRETKDDIKIYNFSSARSNQIAWGYFKRPMLSSGFERPFVKCMWYMMVFVTKNPYLHSINVILFHNLPAYIIDAVISCFGKKPKAVKTYQKINKMLGVLSYFCTHKWTIEDTNTRNLLASLNQTDRTLFNFNMVSLDWQKYVDTIIVGMRVYLVNDPLQTVPQAKRRLIWLTVAHYTTIVLLLGIFYKLLMVAFNLFYAF